MPPRPRAGPRELRLSLLISVGAHLFVALLLALSGLLWTRTLDAVQPGDDIDVEVVEREPGEAARRGFDRAPRTEAPAPRARSAPLRRRGRAGRPAASSTVEPSSRGELPACSPLAMRGCAPVKRARRDRLDVFWGGRRARPRAPRTVARAEANGVRLTRYADGGRLFSSTRGGQRRPDLGTVGLVDLASGKIGGRSGRSACDPYGHAPLQNERTLVLLVDTSASIDAAGRSSRAVYCAAGAALSALARGYEVEVLNFSSVALHQPPTRDAEAIYSTLSAVQKKGTRLPEASRLVSSSGRPRDFVLITDSAIGNLKWTLPAYRSAVRTHADNRALLYLLGDGVVCPRCHYARQEICYSCSQTSTETLLALERAGFVPRFLERPSVVERLVAGKLRQLRGRRP